MYLTVPAVISTRSANTRRFAAVHHAAAAQSDEKLAIKLLDIPQSIEDHCIVYDVFTEVSILEEYKYHRGIW